MNNLERKSRMEWAKSQSRGISCDMSAEAVLRRLDVVDELRELAQELQAAQRLGPIDVSANIPSTTLTLPRDQKADIPASDR